MVGFKYNNNLYYYIKDVFDSIIGILDTSNNIVAKYKYDTWVISWVFLMVMIMM